MNSLKAEVLNLFPALQPAILPQIIVLLSNFPARRAESVVFMEFFKSFDASSVFQVERFNQKE